MFRTHTCGELRLSHAGSTVTLSGWVQRSRDLGGMTFVDLRDRYGITQLAFNSESRPEPCAVARTLGREYVVQATGMVRERESKNSKLPTGDIEIIVESLIILNAAEVPPFTIEEQTDGGDDLRMRYRYLDLRRSNVRANLELRHRMAIETRNYLDKMGFLEVETPVLIKSTPEGARDFVVPSRMNPGEFYALPQSPQTFKQLLMVAGFDRYYQIVKCFRDEDLRADRQPEFTQIDCEMSFVERDDVLSTFEGLTAHLFSTVKGLNLTSLPRMSYADAMRLYGSDKPDTRFGMTFVELNGLVKGKECTIRGWTPMPAIRCPWAVITPCASMASSSCSSSAAWASAAAGGVSSQGTSDGAAPKAARSSTSGVRSATMISGVRRGGRCSCSGRVHRRMHRPGAVRPARPARCSAASLDTGTVTRRCMPVRGSKRGSRESPPSITVWTPSMVIDVSAMAVARTTLRRPAGEGAMALSWASPDISP